MDPGRTPERVFEGHALDEVADLLRSPRPSPNSALPSPIEPKSLAVPADDSLGLYDRERFTPVPQDAGKNDPEKAVAILEANTGSRALQDMELMAQSEVLEGEALSGSKPRSE